MLVPKIIASLKDYGRPQLRADAGAGVLVAMATLPLAMAFAVASGVAPDRGLGTAILAGAIVAALGGSRVQIAGPAAALVVIASGITARYGPDGLMLATVLAGAVLVALGLAELAGAIARIPAPVVTGLTSGMALLIAAGQFPDALGLSSNGPSAWAIAVAVTTVAIVGLWPRVNRRIPAPFVALVVMTLLVRLLHVPVDTLAHRFGAVVSPLSSPRLPQATLPLVTTLMLPAFALAVLVAIASLRSATVADGMIGGRHGANMELVAQGVANIVSPLFGGIPAAGATTRTITNARSGARSPVAGLAHAATLAIVVALFARDLALVPVPAIAALLLVVAWHMSAWRSVVSAWRSPRSDLVVLLVTLVVTVAVDVTVAVALGLLLGVFLFMRRTLEVANVSEMPREAREETDDYDTDPDAVRRRAVPPRCLVYEVDRALAFDAALRFRETITAIDRRPKALIVRMRDIRTIDSTGLHALTDVVRRSQREGTLVILSDVHVQARMALGRSRLLDAVGDDQVCDNIDDALNRARVQLNIPTVDAPPFAGGPGSRRGTQALRPDLVEEDGARISGPRKTQARFTPPGRPSQS